MADAPQPPSFACTADGCWPAPAQVPMDSPLILLSEEGGAAGQSQAVKEAGEEAVVLDSGVEIQLPELVMLELAMPESAGELDAAGKQALAEAAQLLQAGGTVAFPTETVYGLGADATNGEAVAAIFEAKGRPSDNPLIVHVASEEQLQPLVLPYGDLARRLMKAFWPGPLTLILPLQPGAVASQVTAGLDTVAVRMPSHPVALQLINAADRPIAAPSANRSGRPSPTAAGHVRDDLDGRIGGIIDGGITGVGLESTVVAIDEAAGAVTVLRPGGVTAEELTAAGFHVLGADELDGQARQDLGGESGPSSLGSAGGMVGGSSGVGGMDSTGNADSTDKTDSLGNVDSLVSAGGASNGEPKQQARPEAAPRSPGMKYTHYAPRGAMQLVSGNANEVRAHIQAEVDAAQARGVRTGVLTYTEHADGYAADVVLGYGSLQRLETAAQGLYAALRAFDDADVELIWAEACPQEGIGHALMNRLAKAAGGNVVHVPLEESQGGSIG